MPRWTLEARERQRQLIQRWKPWESSTGPVAESGKVISSQNSLKTGCHTAEVMQSRLYLRQFLKNFSKFF